jgi:hypothetical protein
VVVVWVLGLVLVVVLVLEAWELVLVLVWELALEYLLVGRTVEHHKMFQ